MFAAEEFAVEVFVVALEFLLVEVVAHDLEHNFVILEPVGLSFVQMVGNGVQHGSFFLPYRHDTFVDLVHHRTSILHQLLVHRPTIIVHCLPMILSKFNASRLIMAMNVVKILRVMYFAAMMIFPIISQK